jgi:hypothetical protein
MSYEYAVGNRKYEDFSSGRVLYNQKGATSFPARLISEIFLRCVACLEKQGIPAPYSVCDPLCGGAYGLTILGFLHNSHVAEIIASDVDDAVLGLAGRNLSLLTEEGIRERMLQIRRDFEEYGKDSHKAAYESAVRLQAIVRGMPHDIRILCRQSDALKTGRGADNEKADVIISDIPYGEIVGWVTEEGKDAVTIFLQNLLPKLKRHSVVAVISPKRIAVKNENYKRIDRFQIGKRQIVLLQPV